MNMISYCPNKLSCEYNFLYISLGLNNFIPFHVPLHLFAVSGAEEAIQDWSGKLGLSGVSRLNK